MFTAQQYKNIAILAVVVFLAIGGYLYKNAENMEEGTRRNFQIGMGVAGLVVILSLWMSRSDMEGYQDARFSKTFNVGAILDRYNVKNRVRALNLNLFQMAKMLHEANYDIDRFFDSIRDYEITISAPASQVMPAPMPEPVPVVPEPPLEIIPMPEPAAEVVIDGPVVTEGYYGCGRGCARGCACSRGCGCAGVSECFRIPSIKPQPNLKGKKI